MSQMITFQTKKPAQSAPVSAGGVLQRKCDKCRKRKPLLQRAAVSSAPDSVPPIVQEVLRSPGTPLDPATRAFMEPRFGHDFSNVRLHTNAKAAESARAVNAQAYTVGSAIGFGAGQYMPNTLAGRALLAHELAHVIQQSGTKPGFHLEMSQHNDRIEDEARTAAKQTILGKARARPISGLSSSRPIIARGEKWDAFWGVGPWDAYKASELAKKALSAAQATGLPGIHNGPADAWRHCYWNCIMTAEIGADQAKTIADNHEKHGGGPKIENDMDLHNNERGRACEGKNCDGCCQGKLDKGDLRVIESGKLKPSSVTPRAKPPAPGSGEYEY